MAEAAEKHEPDYSYLPKKVAEQAKASDDLMKGPEKTEPTTPETPAGEHGSESKHERKVSEPLQSSDLPPETNKETPPGDKTENFEAKYKVLKGKYDQEVPRLAAEIRQLKGFNEQLTAQISQLQKAKPTSDPNAGFESDSLSDEDLEMMEPEVVAVYKDNKRLREMVQDLKTELTNSVTQIRNEVGQTRQTSTRNVLYSQLDADQRVKDSWRQQNEDPEFVGWLQGTDPIHGIKYIDSLQNAEKIGDSNRVIGIFLKFQQETGKTYSDSPSQPSTGQPTIPKPSTAPPRSRSEGAPPKQPEGKIYTRKEIERFYNDQAAGKYFGKGDEAKRIEADIMKAQHDGRIR